MFELGLSDEIEEDPLFLKFKSVDSVLAGENEIFKRLYTVEGARYPHDPSIFQVANINSDEIKFAHGEEVLEIVSTWEKERLNPPAELPLSNFLPTVENYEKKIGKKKLIWNQ